MIILNMIVRDEEHVLPRALDSILPYVDGAVIVDTGSTDGTLRILESYAKHNRKFFVAQKPWVNFGYNRTQALRLAEDEFGPARYAFVMDADEEFLPQLDFKWPDLQFDAFDVWNLTTRTGERYRRVHLMRLGCSRYEGVIHEYVAGPIGRGLVEDALLMGYFDSNRNQQGKAVKALRDADILLKEPRTPRNVFYLAQSYRDAGQLQVSYAYYHQRAEMGGWDEEVWFSRLMIAGLLWQMGYDPDVVINAYANAALARECRAETFIWWSRYLHSIGREREAQNLFKHARTLPVPNDSLNLDLSCYESMIESSAQI